MKKFLNIALPILKNQISPRSIPYFCTYIVTWRCNAQCQMCNIWKKEKSWEMDIGEISSLFKKIPRINVIRLTGGEPFLREDISDIVRIIRQNTKVELIHITTNGLLKDKIVSFIKNTKGSNIHLKVSLIGYGNRHDEIMCYKGAFQKTRETVEILSSMQNQYKFLLAINHTITDIKSYEDSQKIQELCKKYKLPYLPVLAFKGINLYDTESANSEKKADFVCYGDFNKDDLERILKDMEADVDKIHNTIEKRVKKYYLKGLYNRLILNKNKPQPKCVALRNHIRILPNGDVPVCLYNPEIAGNLAKDDFATLWNGIQAVQLREWVDNCKGCWAECEVIPNAIYTGNIINYLL